jgi:hypothetical protein
MTGKFWETENIGKKVSLVLSKSAKKWGLGSGERVQYIWFGAWTDEQAKDQCCLLISL